MLFLRVLGGLTFEGEGVPLDAMAAQRKSLALLALLAVAGPRGMSRDKLVAYVWPESDTDRGRGALRQTIHAMRQRLGDADVLIGGAELRLNSEVIATDVGRFSNRLARGSLEDAVTEYGGPFLDGYHLGGAEEFEQWVGEQRGRLARDFAGALERLATEAGQRGAWTDAVGWWTRLAATDPLSGRVAAALMRALAGAGDPAAALQHAATHETLLRQELDCAPDPAVVALATQLRSGPPVLTLSSSHIARTLRDGVPSPSASPDTLGDTAAATHATPRRPGGRHVASIAGVRGIWNGNTGQASAAPRVADPDLQRSVAVLAFANTTGDPSNEPFSDALTDDLIAALSKIAGLKVAGRTSAFALKGRGLSVRAIADTLGVANVLEGSVRRSGDRLKVTVQLVSARDNAVLWSETYDREFKDVFAVQEGISRAIVSTLRVRLSGGEGARLGYRPTEDIEAFELYLRGRFLWRTRTRDGLEKAVGYFEQAVERDPSYALAYVGLADAYVNLSDYDYISPTVGLPRARAAAARAIALDSTLAEAHASEGFVLASLEEFGAAEAAFQRAIELQPNYVWTHHYYSLLLVMLGRMDDAMQANRRMLELDPLSPAANAHRGVILFATGDHVEARRQFERALRLAPAFPLTLWWLGVMDVTSGRHAEAIPRLEQARASAPGFPGVTSTLVYAYRGAGRHMEAEAALAELRAEPQDARSQMNIALSYAVFGETGTAFPLLAQATWDVPSLIELRADPLLAQLRSDQRYPGLLRAKGLQP
jgi:TolB-like protein/DNA-binding SARP family transcriptional activator/Flp pilus assembly protein TadD